MCLSLEEAPLLHAASLDMPSASKPLRRSSSCPEETDTPFLIQLCQSGNADSWNTLVHRYQKEIYRVAYSFSHDREDAEDVTSQVFVRLYQSLHTFRNESGFRPWLFRIVYRTFLDMCVRAPSRRPVEHLSTTDDEFGWVTGICDPAPSPETRCLEKEASQILAQAILSMPKMQREVLERLYDEEQSYKEIAVDMGVPLGTVKSRVSRAHKLLRGKLIRYQTCFASV
jgi:RNA polymerase sigma-70 factor (ECF subfamily)